MAGGDKFSFLTGQRAVVYNKVHGNGRFGNLLKINGAGIFRCADGISDVDVRNTGNSHNRADFCFRNVCFVQSVKFIQFADPHFLQLVRFVVIHNHSVLIDFQTAVVYFAHTDTSHIFIVINGTDQNLCAGIRVSFRRRDILQNGFK